MKTLGAALALAGVTVLVGYGAYYFFRDFFASESIPLPVRIALPAILVGLLVLLGSVARDRYQSSKSESFKEVER